ncbi:MAG: tryptophan synthase subunit alpha [Pyrinomonadaceae bacterium]
MSRITNKFADLRATGGKGFIPFVTAGDPDMEFSLAIILRLAELGASVIELGVPFSDPMADGPTIQRSSQRSLDAGTNLEKIFDLVKRFRERSDVPLVLFSYLNPLLRFGFDRFCSHAVATGVDGLLVTDVVGFEAIEIGNQLKANGLDLISLIAPTTSDERLAEICRIASGFIYAVSRAGVTGVQKETSGGARVLVERARRFTDLPIAVGFGISSAEQIREVWQYADAAVVGSAIVAEIERSVDDGNAVEAVEGLVSRLLPEIAKDV